MLRENHIADFKELLLLRKNSCITRAVHVEFHKKSTETVGAAVVCFWNIVLPPCAVADKCSLLRAT